MFHNLKLMIKPNLNSTPVLINFEKAVMKIPPNINSMLYFLLSQAYSRIWLKNQYCNDLVIALELKKLAALVFVPIENVTEYFEGLLEN